MAGFGLKIKEPNKTQAKNPKKVLSNPKTPLFKRRVIKEYKGCISIHPLYKPIRAGITIKNIITVACAVIILLYI